MGPWLVLGCSFWHTDLIGITPRGLSKVPQDWRKGMNDQRLRSFPPDNHDQAHLLQRPRPCCGRASISDSQNLSGISALLGKEFTKKDWWRRWPWPDSGMRNVVIKFIIFFVLVIPIPTNPKSLQYCQGNTIRRRVSLLWQIAVTYRFIDTSYQKRFFFSIKCAKLSMNGPPYAKVPHILTSPDYRDSPSLPGIPGICPRGTHTNASTHSFLTTSCQHPSWPALDSLPEGFAQCCLFQ